MVTIMFRWFTRLMSKFLSLNILNVFKVIDHGLGESNAISQINLACAQLKLCLIIDIFVIISIFFF